MTRQRESTKTSNKESKTQAPYNNKLWARRPKAPKEVPYSDASIKPEWHNETLLPKASPIFNMMGLPPLSSITTHNTVHLPVPVPNVGKSTIPPPNLSILGPAFNAATRSSAFNTGVHSPVSTRPTGTPYSTGPHNPAFNAGPHNPAFNAGPHKPSFSTASNNPSFNTGPHSPVHNTGPSPHPVSSRPTGTVPMPNIGHLNMPIPTMGKQIMTPMLGKMPMLMKQQMIGKMPFMPLIYPKDSKKIPYNYINPMMIPPPGMYIPLSKDIPQKLQQSHINLSDTYNLINEKKLNDIETMSVISDDNPIQDEKNIKYMTSFTPLPPEKYTRGYKLHEIKMFLPLGLKMYTKSLDINQDILLDFENGPIRNGKLVLLLDLDNTLLHTASQSRLDLNLNLLHFIDELGDPELYKFTLPNFPNIIYYMKLRPGIREFLQILSLYYEMSIYTNATKEYADVVISILDPDRSLFNDRIVARNNVDEKDLLKSASRLYPNLNKRFILSFDDRRDVWADLPHRQVVKAEHYDFFDSYLNELNDLYHNTNNIHDVQSNPLEVQSNSFPTAVEASPLEVTSNSRSPAESSSNYLSLKSRATPGDRGNGDGSDWTSSGDNPEEQEILTRKNKDIQPLRTGILPGRTENVNPEERESTDVTSSGKPVADLREAEGQLNRGGATPSGKTSSGTPNGRVDDSDWTLDGNGDDIIFDYDRHLHYMINVFLEIHKRFFDDPLKSNVGTILEELQNEALDGTGILLTGYRKNTKSIGILHADCEQRQKEVALELGSTILNKLSDGRLTHIVAGKNCTDNIIKSKDLCYSHIFKVHTLWLYSCRATLIKMDENIFNVDDICNAYNNEPPLQPCKDHWKVLYHHLKQFHNTYHNSPPEVTTSSSTTTRGRLADSSPPEVTTLSSTSRGGSSNYLSLKGNATPRDRGDSDSSDEDKTSSGIGMKSSTGPRVEPAADLGEAKGEVNREGSTPSGKTSGGTARLKNKNGNLLLSSRGMRLIDLYPSLINGINNDYNKPIDSLPNRIFMGTGIYSHGTEIIAPNEKIIIRWDPTKTKLLQNSLPEPNIKKHIKKIIHEDTPYTNSINPTKYI